MENITDKVKMYLTAAQQGKAEISEALLDEAAASFRAVLKEKFSPRKREYTLRMSNIGRPLCQQQLEKAGVEPVQEPYNTTMKFLIGDMVEIATITVMKGAGVGVDEVHTPVKADFNGTVVSGTLDIVVDGSVYDIKSASPASFQKFSAPDAFAKLQADDPFGYLAQGYGYAGAAGKPFGGWIVVDKVSGELHVCATPIADNSYRKHAVQQSESNIKALVGGEEFRPAYDPIRESFRGKPTGEAILPIGCNYCGFKVECYARRGMDITYKANPKSDARYPKWHWYVSERGVSSVCGSRETEI